ncbi:STAS domain-containing protein [Pseudonocardia lacus]|uniref:STAS domain-containing protein n=1 Tax=Pseudonocardia lacus TaxID=2835865 RepID=UPI001BDBD4F0|nr:STAS domain-containing protein [Pseudonocardia lacus]
MNGHQQGDDTGPVSFALVADTLVVSGEIDLLTAPALGAFLQSHLDGSRTCLALDLSRVMFFAAAGLHPLLGALDTAERRGVALRPVRLSPAVVHVLELTDTVDCFAEAARAPNTPSTTTAPSRRGEPA